MTWIKLDDKCPLHPKVVRLCNESFGVWVKMLCYCSQYLTDGKIPIAAMYHIDTESETDTLKNLENAGLIKVEGDMITVINYLEHQKSKVEVEEEREKNTERIRKYRVRSCNDFVTPLQNHSPATVKRSCNGGVTEPDTDTDTETTTPPTPPQAGGAGGGENWWTTALRVWPVLKRIRGAPCNMDPRKLALLIEAAADSKVRNPLAITQHRIEQGEHPNPEDMRLAQAIFDTPQSAKLCSCGSALKRDYAPGSGKISFCCAVCKKAWPERIIKAINKGD